MHLNINEIIELQSELNALLLTTEEKRVNKKAATEKVEISHFLNKLSPLIADNASVIVLFLQQQNEDGRDIGHYIMHSQRDPTQRDPGAVTAYFELLKNLITSLPEEAIGLLQQQDADDWNTCIAYYMSDSMVVEAYLALFKDLMINQPAAAIMILQQQNKVGLNIAYVFFAYSNTDPEVVDAYVTLLKNSRTTQPEATIELLQQRDHLLKIGYSICSVRDPKVIKGYFELLKDLITSTIPGQPETAIRLLQQQDQGGGNIGKYIVGLLRGDPEVAEAYLELLEAASTPMTKQLNSYDPAIQAQLKDAATELLLALPAGDAKTLPLLERCVNNKDRLGKYCGTFTEKKKVSFAFWQTTPMVSKIAARMEEINQSARKPTMK
jgi:hypothetical protein